MHHALNREHVRSEGRLRYAEHSPSITSGANSAVSARSTKSSGTASFSVSRCRSCSERRDLQHVDAPEEIRRLLAVLAVPADRTRSAAPPLPESGAPAPSRRAARSWRRPRSAPPPTITKYCGTAFEPTRRHASLEADRRDVMLAAAVRAPADLDAHRRRPPRSDRAARADDPRADARVRATASRPAGTTPRPGSWRRRRPWTPRPARGPRPRDADTARAHRTIRTQRNTRSCSIVTRTVPSL